MAEITSSSYRFSQLSGNVNISTLGTFDVVVNRNSSILVKKADANDQYPLMRRLGFNNTDTRLLYPLENFNFFFETGADSDAVYNASTTYTGNLAAIINPTSNGRVNQLIGSMNAYFLQHNEISMTALTTGFTVKGHNTLGSHKVPFISGSRDVVGYMNIHVVDATSPAPTITNSSIQLPINNFHILDSSLFLTGYSSNGNASPWKLNIINPNNDRFIIDGEPIKFNRSIPWEVVQNGGVMIDLSGATSNSTHTISYQVADVTSKKYSVTRTLTITAVATPPLVVDPPTYLGLTTYSVNVGSKIDINFSDLMASIPPYHQIKNYPLGAIEIIGQIGDYRHFLNNSATSDRIGRVLNKNLVVSRSSNTSVVANKDVLYTTLRATGANGFQIEGLKVGSGIVKFKATAISGTTQSTMSSVTGDIKINVTSTANQPPSALNNSTVNCYKGGQVTLSSNLFSVGYADPENDPIGFLKIVTIPNQTNNVLSYQGQNLTTPNSILAWDNIQNGGLSYFDAGNQPIGTNITLQFTVADVGSGQYFATNRTLTIKIVQPPVPDPVPPLDPLPNGIEVIASTLITVPSYPRNFNVGDINKTDPLATEYKQLDFRDFTTNMYPYDYNARIVRGGRIIRFGYYYIDNPTNPTYLTSGAGTQYLYRGLRTSTLTQVTTSTLLTDAVAWTPQDENTQILDIGTERSIISGKNYLFINYKRLDAFRVSIPNYTKAVPFFDIALDYDGFGLDPTRVKRVSLHQMPQNLTALFREFGDRTLVSNPYYIWGNEGIPLMPLPDEIHYGGNYNGGVGLRPMLGIKWNDANSMGGLFTVDQLSVIQNQSGYRDLFKFHYPELDYQNTLSMTYSYYGMVNGIQMGYHQSNRDSFERFLMGGEPMINGTTVSMQQLRSGVFSIDTSKSQEIICSYLIRGSVTGAVVNGNEYY